MQVSINGVVMLEDEESVVLRAYRCPAGWMTIGAGLTAASGVITPKAGMVITLEESRRLTRLALERNYEPAVNKAMGAVKQTVFDGATLFHWNTGAIGKASWVGKFKAGSIAMAEQSFKSWNKAAGKVMPGLVNRRVREWALIEFGRYATDNPAIVPVSAVKPDLVALGYAGTEAGVRAFQGDHGLTVDGKVGPATRSTIEREKQKRLATKASGASGAGGAVVGTGGELSAPGTEAVDLNTLIWAAGIGLALAAAVYLAFLVWRNRGPLFAWLPEPVKDWFEARGVVLGRRVRV